MWGGVAGRERERAATSPGCRVEPSFSVYLSATSFFIFHRCSMSPLKITPRCTYMANATCVPASLRPLPLREERESGPTLRHALFHLPQSNLIPNDNGVFAYAR